MTTNKRRGIFDLSVKCNDEKIIDQKFNTVKDLDEAMAEVKKKFR